MDHGEALNVEAPRQGATCELKDAGRQRHPHVWAVALALFL